MILPIYTYGQPVLKKKGVPVEPAYPFLDELIDNMWETMYAARGVGLAAPQIGQSLQLFIIDTIQIMKEGEEEIISESGDEWSYEEGCLSIPDLRGDVDRKPNITITYQDASFNTYKEHFDGVNARVIQHEYDHIIGQLFTEKLKPIKRALLKRKLEQMKKGKVKADYKLKRIG
ncbi:UNVERIFIED_CONTAM: hypothetical protein GTU68_014843 [Idotea baltica]|nr:hypothetical protein [Idotea baltica]